MGKTLLLATLFALIAVLTYGGVLGPGIGVGPAHPVAPIRLGGLRQVTLLHVSPARGGGFLVFYSTLGPPLSEKSTIRSVHLDKDGHPDFSTTHILTDAPGGWTAVGDTAQGPMLFWSRNGNVVFAPIDEDGALAGGGVEISGTGFPKLAQCDATHCMVAYGPAPPTFVIYNPPQLPTFEAIVSANGEIITTGISYPDFVITAMASSSDAIVALGSSSGNARAVAFENDGRVRFDRKLAVAGYEPEVSADFDGRRFTVVVSPGLPSADRRWPAVVMHLTANGILSSPVTLLTIEGSRRPRVMLSWNGDEHLVAFNSSEYDFDELGGSVFRGRLTAGLALRGPYVRLNPSRDDGVVAAVATNGGRFFLGWHEQRESVALGTIVAGDVQTTPEPPGTMPLKQQPNMLASRDDGYLAVWSEPSPTSELSQLREQRFRRDGTALDETPRQLDEPLSVYNVCSASIGSDTLVIWRRASQLFGDPQLRGAIVRADGTTLDVTMPSSHDLGGGNQEADVATNGDAWMVFYGMYAIRVSRTGTVFSPLRFSFGTSLPGTIRAASDGNRYFVVWHEGLLTELGIHTAVLEGDGTFVQTERATFEDNPYSQLVSVSFDRGAYLVGMARSGQSAVTRLANGVATTTVLPPEFGILRAVVPFSDGWLAVSRSGLAARIADDGSVVSSTSGPILFKWPFGGVMVSNGDGTLGLLDTQPVAIKPYGSALQLFLREVDPFPMARRRSVH